MELVFRRAEGDVVVHLDYEPGGWTFIRPGPASLYNGSIA